MTTTRPLSERLRGNPGIDGATYEAIWNLERQRDALLALVESAYREGFRAGGESHGIANGPYAHAYGVHADTEDESWNCSLACNALTKGTP